LRRLGIEAQTIDAEKSAMTPVEIGTTMDRSVLGIMVDFAKSFSYHLDSGHLSDRELHFVEDRLAETPCRARRPFDQVIFPRERVPELLRRKWLVNTGVESPNRHEDISNSK